jgi:carbonic anhydrase/acetyltransferase-like protein (isoleucine patch superfamily)
MQMKEPALFGAARVDALARIEGGVELGDGCDVRSGAVLCAGTRLGAGVRVGANAVFVEPEAGQRACQVENQVQIGANAVLHAGITLGADARVRPGAVVTRSVPPGAIVDGNPAAIVGYVNMVPQALAPQRAAADDRQARIVTTNVRGVTVHNLPLHADLRGDLTVGEFGRDVPFAPQRYFIVLGVPNREVRGEHAHRRCQQFLVCVRGSCSVVADDGQQRVEVALDAPNRGLYLPAMTWGTQYKHSADAVLLVFASDHYDAADYIREYGQFLQAVNAAQQGTAA